MIKSIIQMPYGEMLYKDLMYRITMKTRDNKKLYLSEDHWYGKNAEKISCKWTFTANDALWFETQEDAQDFCRDYFKNFDRYEIENFIFAY